MKILNWMQSKLSGRHNTSKRPPPSSLSSSSRYSTEEAAAAYKEEFSDWPHALLAIGTFGNNQIKGDHDSEKHEPANIQSTTPLSPQYFSDFTPEEVGKLQRELTRLLSLKPPTSQGGGSELKPNLIQSGKSSDHHGGVLLDDNNVATASTDLSRSKSVVKSKGKDVVVDHNNNVIRQRSISFLLKKLFACHGGFAPAPSLRDPISESRMEKLLRAILHKKVYPQTSPSSSKKYLGNRSHSPVTDPDDQQSQDKANDGCKWVKTDSEYIVLEI